MKYQIQLTTDAKADIQDLKEYVLQVWSKDAWQAEAAELKQLIASIGMLPWSGSIPTDLAKLGITEYRQRLSKQNRLIYFIDEPNLLVTIFIVCSQRRDLIALLQRRLLAARR